jgi:predicted MFS family arabinose efflux permease
MGAYQMIQGIGNIIGFAALGWVYDNISPETPIILCSVALAVATLIIAAFVQETHVVSAKSKASAPAETAAPEIREASGK